MELLIMQFSPSSCHFICHRSKYSPQHLFRNIPNLCPSLNVRNLISHPYKTIGNITVLYILIFTFLDSKQENKRFGITW
jgi:hypothetical protein